MYNFAMAVQIQQKRIIAPEQQCRKHCITGSHCWISAVSIPFPAYSIFSLASFSVPAAPFGSLVSVTCGPSLSFAPLALSPSPKITLSSALVGLA